MKKKLVAGTIVVGIGSLLAAHAAGAFRSNTYLSLGSKLEDHVYVGGDVEKIRGLLDSNSENSYKAFVKKTHWENMKIEHLIVNAGISKEGDPTTNGKEEEVFKFISAWCTSISKRKLDAVPVEIDSEEKKVWDAFVFACFLIRDPVFVA
ncbi:hypothetical protein [Candidatus Mycoplasma haematohominis]|uniref:Uncharacterized protein n=1 Tax=Candidatus Mycoplasma haematohominis TaxID=1494318 RepID=A0A478FQ90_9MOLU|nr:hypothetical protein [Candidatus Mycoplasma haemohominis]GCE63698.1 hypothetical protein MHSWG343_06980 [Candidatus Mycoplasma haemohominis]